ncbi:carbohydrate binding domain-containing protein [Lacticaseibacillus paracasei]|uniref:phage head spike fiber domain-containing protein n=1 Tax=Lacticaseibacillus paracasei TaxID=1597 RepID=UPI001EDC97A1|nr:carbohydrate binding domain-containing protein [Lacticaseibacillus paracasei]MCG4285179.1 carbohydrate binding domain-containing protein [Lacticaseibacillus paracasei]
MADITHGTWIKDGKAVDAVYQGGVKVYGRNLYTDTRDFDNSDVWINYGTWNKTGEKFNGLTVMGTKIDWNGLGQTIQAKKGEVYTFSVYARYESGNGDSFISIGPPDSPSTDSRKLALNATWQRLTGTFTMTADGPIIIRMEGYPNYTNTLLIAGPKLERGTISTPYSQAPEDVM